MRILELSRVSPPPNSSKASSEFSLPLTFSDVFWFKLPPVERLFFYRLNALTFACFNSDIVPKLKQSLSLALLHYLPLAGNLKWPSNAPKPSISYTPGDGFHSQLLNPMLTLTFFQAMESTMLLTQHAVLDGKTTTMFIKSWAYICKQGNPQNSTLPPELTPVLDRSVLKDTGGLDMIYLKNWFDNIAKARDFLDENGFVFGVQKVSSLVKQVKEQGVLEGMEKKLSLLLGFFERLATNPIQVISVAGSPGFGVYGSDFGWGKPVKVDIVSIDKNEAVSLAESRDGSSGVEIGLALKKHEMERFSSLFLTEF
ncbi:putative HXXXD-type acyl-transferase family protein [Hibiscus syriacus]|uniref:HXXXD-type acyl-transferase family protein n=1 Tax=Hibiscus syriacus TaxID=106335 RepID=A0A6A3BDU1_HIBSY|nr:putative HXXXD-type acyl-transferase family protein [Hibiscus syriacus]